MNISEKPTFVKVLSGRAFKSNTIFYSNQIISAFFENNFKYPYIFNQYLIYMIYQLII